MSNRLINPTLENFNDILPHLWTCGPIHSIRRCLSVIYYNFQELISSDELWCFNNWNRIVRSTVLIDSWIEPMFYFIPPVEHIAYRGAGWKRPEKKEVSSTVKYVKYDPKSMYRCPSYINYQQEFRFKHFMKWWITTRLIFFILYMYENNWF